MDVFQFAGFFQETDEGGSQVIKTGRENNAFHGTVTLQRYEC
jgi:hypothetical protein